MSGVLASWRGQEAYQGDRQGGTFSTGGMASLEKLYEAGEKLSKVVDQRLPQQSDELVRWLNHTIVYLSRVFESSCVVLQMRTEYGVILAGVKSNDPLARRLSSQFISRFFNHFPSLCSEALEAMLDLCEDDDVVVRKQAIKASSREKFTCRGPLHARYLPPFFLSFAGSTSIVSGNEAKPSKDSRRARTTPPQR